VVKTRRTINHQDTKTPSLDQRVQRPACGRIRSSRRLDATTDCLGVLVVEKCRRSSRREEALTFFCVWNPQISQMNADFIFYLRNPRHLRIKQKSPLCALVPWWLKPAGQSTTKTQRHQVWISACSVRPVAGFGSSRRLDATTDCLGVLVVEKCRRGSRREEAPTEKSEIGSQ